MLKLSTLLSKLDFSTMGDLRADLVGEAERLEGVEEVREVIKKECEKADAAVVKDRKPLKWISGRNVCGLILTGGKGDTLQRWFISHSDAIQEAKYHPGSRVVQVMQPDGDHCPTQYIDGMQLDYEWAIYFPEDDFWAGKSETISYVPTTSFDELIRFQSKANAMRFKSNKHLHLSATVFPVPKLREAK